jgi:3-methyladenine DNA glycosylase AlkD
MKTIHAMDDLIEKVIKQIEEDLSWGDRTAIAALLSFVPEENLLDFLAQ